VGSAASRAQTAAKAAVDEGRAGPGVSASAGRKGFKAGLDDLRERMRRLGLGYDEIAAEMARRHRLRPRESYRLAWSGSTPLPRRRARTRRLSQA
jgi:hypothetical protein